MKEPALTEKEIEDFNVIISHKLIPELIKFADKYNFDRDSIIKFAVDMLSTLIEISTFEHFKEGEN